jgi:NitT/TauT family transport system permease protein
MSQSGKMAVDAGTSAAAIDVGNVRPERGYAFRAAVPTGTKLTVSVVSALVLLGIWQAAVDLGAADPVFLPAPLHIVVTFWQMVTTGSLLSNTGISVLRVWSAFLLAAVMAVPIGMLMSSYRIVGAALEPVIDFIRYLPVPALVPLAIIWFGIGETPKIFLLWLGTFFQLVLMVAEDMNRVPMEYVEVSYTFGAKPWQVLRDVAIRAMLPSLLDNMRIALGWCWTYLIIAEIVAANSGIGYLIWTAQRYMETDQVMAGIMVIGVIGLVTDQALRALHRSLFRYLA